MAVTKKTIEEVADEYGYDLSEQAAKKYVDAYVQPTLTEINQAEQRAIADTQATRKALENDYFKQYRANTYSAQSRGLTGGLAEMDNQLLRMQLGQANADLTKNLLMAQNEAAEQRGTALSNAEVYKTNYLNDLRNKVAQLQQADYDQRYREWQFAEQLAQAEKEFEENKRRWQLEYNLSLDRYNMEKDQFEYEKSLRDDKKKEDDLQYAANVKEYLAMELPDVANTYMAYLNSGDTQRAGEYLVSQANKLSKNYGVDARELVNQITTVANYNLAKNTAADADIKSAMSTLNLRRLGYDLLGTGLTVASLSPLAPFTAPFAVNSWIKANKAGKEYENYQKTLQDAAQKRDTIASTIPSWYAPYIAVTQ